MYSLVVSVIFCVAFRISSAQIGDFCQTPYRQQGECLTITSCQPLFQLLKNKPLSSASTDLLRRSHCGFDGTLPKVCCPLNDNPAPVPSTTPASTGGDPLETDLLPGTETCGLGSQDRIYGGEKTQLGEYPWMALIEYLKPNGQKGFYCGGVLISKRYILTAAHCLKGKDLPPSWQVVSVRLGEYNTDTDIDCVVVSGSKQICAPPAVNIAIEDRIAHEDYLPNDPNQYHDIAVLRLVRDVKFTDYVKAVCLPRKPTLLSKSFINENLTVAGWGKTENRSESNIVLKLEVPVKSDDVCTSTYTQARVKLDSRYQICAGGAKGRDSCRGDSGGPLMNYVYDGSEINWYSVGVVSFGPSPCGMENWPGVYTKVSTYMPWIIKQLKP